MKVETLTIANGEATSGAVLIQGYRVGGFITPAALTGTSFSFEVADNMASATWTTAKKADGSADSVTVAASGGYAFPSSVFGFGAVRIVSGSNEGDDRDIVCSFKV